MRLFIIAALSAVLGLVCSSVVLVWASSAGRSETAVSSASLSDSEIDVHISTLIDEQLAMAIDKRLSVKRKRIMASNR